MVLQVLKLAIVLWVVSTQCYACTGFSTEWNNRGLGPELVRSYENHIFVAQETKGASFRCFDGSRTIPVSYINDDYCDCVDGSDEPGTSACVLRTDDIGPDQGQGMFYCQNTHFKPEYIYKWKVHDGICDCCDGSDEQPYDKVVCKNTCKELGHRWAQEQSRQRFLQKKGRELRDQLISHGRNLLDEWKLAEQDLRQRLIPQLEASIGDYNRYQEALKAQSSLNDQQENQGEAFKNEKEYTKTDDQFDESYDDNNQLDFQTQDNIDEDSQIQHQTDHDNMVQQRTPSDEYADHQMNQEAEEVNDVPKDDGREPDGVSEYAQWMIGQDSKGDESRMDSKSSTPLSEQAFTRFKFMLHPQFWIRRTLRFWQSLTSLRRFFVYKRAEDGTPSSKISNNIAQWEQNLRDANQKQQALSEKLRLAQEGPHMLALMALKDPCIKVTADQYTYNICLLTEAVQNGQHFTSRLGTYYKTELSENGFVIYFNNGESCWNGPPRSLTAMVTCGIETRLLRVTETERCTYVATIESPAACLGTAETEASPKDNIFQDEL